MTTRNEAETAGMDEAEALMGGAIRDALGLKREDLDIALRVAKLALDRDAPVEAVKLYSSILICEPMHVEGHIGAAVCALRLGVPDVALQTASAAVALAPRDARGYLLSGRACLALNRPVEAREDFEEAARLALEVRSADVVIEARRLLAAVAPGDGPR